MQEEPMNATWIVTVFEVIDTTMETLDHHSHVLTKVPDSEVLTVAVVAAKFFQNHHERALAVLKALHYLSGPLSPSRFNRRLHALADWLAFLTETLGEVLTKGRSSSSTACRCPSVAALGLAAAAKCVGDCIVGIVRLKMRSSSAGACI